MVSYIDEQNVKEKVHKKLLNKQGCIELKEIDELFNIITEINKERKIFTDLPDPISNLAYNILYIQIAYRIIFKEYNEDYVISEIKGSIKHIDIVMDIIIKSAEELQDANKQAYYELMGNNHIIMAEVYKVRSTFYVYSIDILCESIDIPEIDARMTSDDVMIKLCELTESGECSRLQRALDILMKHGNNLTIADKIIDQSNAHELGISNDDINSLHLLTKLHKWTNSDFNMFIGQSVYKSIYNEIDNPEYDDTLYIKSLYNLYVMVFNMSVLKNITDTESYINENVNDIKELINELKHKKRMRICHEITESKVFNDIMEYSTYIKIRHFNIDSFKNNVINNYLKYAESIISCIISMPMHTENIELSGGNNEIVYINEPETTEVQSTDYSNTEVASALSPLLISSNTLTVNNPLYYNAQRDNEPEEIIVNENTGNANSCLSLSTESTNTFWNSKNIAIIAICILISIIILSIYLLYPNESKQV
ncbi:hypothetical protein NEPAR06_0508 [Nematocida parisii]|uniref:Uncharacterized protein n=1 Tax=Nematocida parisii (strain ERTm3) TaxID=935791 RepID=I3EJE4_NEMP3|nr:uncharacterized protein NEPG_01127 [Nematocida parisii ERTm1]EIJ89341.1 hypothetical protein NEQG_00111 [Nematocida parisii ERTm3]KAI5142574.1 hypothetical protein NEPAR07_0179 [Nematocida parisii]EIJ94459.1 hypothetical protein NEPG_01127 [Nematocida parisii ERTm1]KAI5153508.1 hypothetical protein NEPAR06_0508 [Nematocida parisii]KAI5156931.1 hypothetical protein NEPAR05_0914 [Nematocida parisii]|eukprot:XP_013058955.1 hypothetical protein NEPG_01127 [Nematocida parisii ERTm1]